MEVEPGTALAAGFSVRRPGSSGFSVRRPGSVLDAAPSIVGLSAWDVIVCKLRHGNPCQLMRTR